MSRICGTCRHCYMLGRLGEWHGFRCRKNQGFVSIYRRCCWKHGDQWEPRECRECGNPLPSTVEIQDQGYCPVCLTNVIFKEE